MRVLLHGDEARAPLVREAVEQRGLAPRAGAHVEPRSRVARRPRRAPGRGATSWLPSSCTPARPSRTHASTSGAPSTSVPAMGDQRPGSTSGRSSSSSMVMRPGRATSDGRAGALSAASSGGQLAATGCRGRRGTRARSRPDATSAWPATRRRRRRGRPAAAAPSRPCRAAATLRRTALTNPARAAGARRRAEAARQLARRVHGRVVGHPHGQELMGAQAQDVLQARLDLVPRPGHAGRQDRVVPALPAQGAVGELGGEGRVAPGEPVAVQQLRQGEVRVGIVLAHGAQELQRSGAGLVGHARVSSSVSRAPRAQSAAGISRLPAGWTRSSRTGLRRGADEHVALADAHASGRQPPLVRDARRVRHRAAPRGRSSRHPGPACRRGPAGRCRPRAGPSGPAHHRR